MLLAAMTAAMPFETGAQATAPGEPFVPTGLGTGPYSEMSALMEVTIFGIDVLTLTVRVSPETAARLEALTRDRSYSEPVADSVAAVILEGDDLWARQVLHRDVGYDRLVGGMRETVEKAAAAGYVDRAYVAEFSDGLPDWFGFLRETGASEGDEIFFRIQGDTVRTVYRTVGGELLLDRRVVDARARRASIPAFFAPETRFRRRLVESLLSGESR